MVTFRGWGIDSPTLLFFIYVFLVTFVKKVCYCIFIISLTINPMSVKITISGDGLSFERETDMHKAGQIIAFLSNDATMGMTTADPYSPAPVAVLGTSENRRKSPRQALMESDANTNAEKIVVLANFICERNGVDTFSPKEVQVEFKKAGEPLPKNLTRDFNTAITQGFILENDEGDYSLTDLGLEVVTSGFGDYRQVAGGGTTKKRKGGKSKKVTTVREEVTELEITPQMEGFPDYWNFTVKGTRILWLLAFASENNVSDGLTPVEVEYLASKLKDQIKPGDFTALTKNNIKKGYLTVKNGHAKILKIGEDFLKSTQ